MKRASNASFSLNEQTIKRHRCADDAFFSEEAFEEYSVVVRPVETLEVAQTNVPSKTPELNVRAATVSQGNPQEKTAAQLKSDLPTSLLSNDEHKCFLFLNGNTMVGCAIMCVTFLH